MVGMDKIFSNVQQGQLVEHVTPSSLGDNIMA
jgi:hypothetical protein